MAQLHVYLYDFICEPMYEATTYNSDSSNVLLILILTYWNTDMIYLTIGTTALLYLILKLPFPILK